MYYNTTHETEEQCTLFNISNMTQDDMVLQLIKEKKLKTFSASSIFKMYPVQSVPITSIRRSLNTLKKELNAIVETGKKVKGLYGRNEIEYKLI